MSWRLSRFKVGDVIVVRSQAEILQTLDSQGRLEGLQFMPEMLKYCGQRLRVSAVAHKTCDWTRKPGSMRRLNTAVHLETLRCDGSAHGGCEAECLLIWKDAWLRAEKEPESAVAARPGNSGFSAEQLLRCTRKESGANAASPCYACQATEIHGAGTPLSPADPWQYINDVRTGNRTLGHTSRVVFLGLMRWTAQHIPFGYKLFQRLNEAAHKRMTGRGTPCAHGAVPAGVPTPTESLDLKEGDYARIKSVGQIEKTIDAKWKNRGLTFDPEEMAPYCGQVVQVRRRVTRIIDEKTGEMLHMKQPCITFDGVFCTGDFASGRLNCPKAIPSYWREVWLEKANGPKSPDSGAG